MVCTFENFNMEILKMPLPYKYVVHSPKVKKPEECYEYLHAHSSHWREYNRCLVIPAKDRHFPTGICKRMMWEEWRMLNMHDTLLYKAT